ncbi:spore germination protein YndF [Paenibacillus macerans]|uniref:Ger(x)C family spore germination protein n=1 Tax=Paenibacillus macerans TaxID=44252 RepID=UPI001B072355|nr:Ger(x)C family spore germination protein [Paenibacillus macerans]GIP13695.1 spore germination protein YndF [Paenibacillus macerans]
MTAFSFRSRRSRLLQKCIAGWMACAVLAGCWDSREIEDLSIILGVAIDMDQDMLELTYQHLIAQKNQENAYANITTLYGDSIQYASREQAKQVAHAPLYNFIRLVLISDQALRKWRIDQLLDTYTRSYKPSRNSVVMVVKGSAKEALAKMGKHKDIPSMDLRDLAKNSVLNEKIPQRITLGDISIRISQGADFLIQRLDTGEGGNRLTGAALISGQTKKFAGWIDEEDISGINWMLGNTEGTVVKTEDPRTNQTMVFEVDRVKRKLLPHADGQDISFTVLIKTALNLNENRVVSADLLKEPFLQTAREAAQEEIKESVLRSLSKLQKEKADVAGFRTKIKTDCPEAWDRVKNNWPETFSQIPIDVLVDAEVRQTGAYSKEAGAP